MNQKRMKRAGLAALLGGCMSVVGLVGPAAAQASPSSAPVITGNAFCSGWYYLNGSNSVPLFKFRECIIREADLAGGGARVRSVMQSVNLTHSPRYVDAVTRTIVNGRLTSTITCKPVASVPGHPVNCNGPSVSVPYGQYVRAQGNIGDYGQSPPQISGWAYSPVYRPV